MEVIAFNLQHTLETVRNSLIFQLRKLRHSNVKELV